MADLALVLRVDSGPAVEGLSRAAQATDKAKTAFSHLSQVQQRIIQQEEQLRRQRDAGAISTQAYNRFIQVFGSTLRQAGVQTEQAAVAQRNLTRATSEATRAITLSSAATSSSARTESGSAPHPTVGRRCFYPYRRGGDAPPHSTRGVIP